MVTIYIVEQLEKNEQNQEHSLPLQYHSRRLKIVGIEENSQKAFWEITKTSPTVVFIELDDLQEEGLELGQSLNQLKHPPQIIFIASDDSYIQQAIEMAAFDYIIKPFQPERMKQIIEKLMYAHEQKRFPEKMETPIHYGETIVRNKYTDKFVIKLEERIKVINTDEIVYIGTENRRVYVKTLEGKYTVDTPLYIMEKKLGPSFVRIHRSFIINIYYIVEIQPWFGGTYTLLFKDGSSTPVSRSHIKDIRKILEF